MDLRIHLGMLTPSSNTVLEPVTCGILAGIEGVTAHFSRLPVTEITLDASSVGQFDVAPMLAAALPDAIAVVRTNLAAAPLAEELEAETDIPVHDSVAVTVRGTLKRASAERTTIEGRGRVLAAA